MQDSVNAKTTRSKVDNWVNPNEKPHGTCTETTAGFGVDFCKMSNIKCPVNANAGFCECKDIYQLEAKLITG
jgi:endonuclease III